MFGLILKTIYSFSDIESIFNRIYFRLIDVSRSVRLVTGGRGCGGGGCGGATCIFNGRYNTYGISILVNIIKTSFEMYITIYFWKGYTMRKSNLTKLDRVIKMVTIPTGCNTKKHAVFSHENAIICYF